MYTYEFFYEFFKTTVNLDTFCFPKILYISNKSQGINIRAKLQDAYLAKISLLFLGHVNYIKLFLKNLAFMFSSNSMENNWIMKLSTCIE